MLSGLTNNGNSWHLICFPTGSVEISPHQRILGALLEKYDGDGLPFSDKSRAVLVSFGAKLIRIIDLVNFLRFSLVVGTAIGYLKRTICLIGSVFRKQFKTNTVSLEMKDLQRTTLISKFVCF